MAKQSPKPAKKAASQPTRERKRAAKTKSTPKNQATADGPSRDTRFQPGQSGNPNGRPRKDRNLLKLIEEELDAEMQVTEGSRSIRLSKREALAKSMVNNAIKGDQRALNNLLKQLPKPKHDESEEYAAVPLEAILNFLMRKGQRPEGGEADND